MSDRIIAIGHVSEEDLNYVLSVDFYMMFLYPDFDGVNGFI